MANQEHLDILKQGVEVWNTWREQHQNTLPELAGAILPEADLSGANLNGANLSGAMFQDADLSGASLYGADLIKAFFLNAILPEADLRGADLNGAVLGGASLGEADLRGANLVGANLSMAFLSGANLNAANLNAADLGNANLVGANLRDANLQSANLRNADLNGADLSGADLIGADLIGTNLHDANLSQARLGETSFGNVDLRGAKGLATVRHSYPSTIGIDAIIESQGKIPESFLRGAGVPDSIIEAIPSLIGSLKPIDFYSCFISYSSKDQGFAERLYADLQSKGVRCWFAPHDIRIGDEFRSRIDESIRVHDKLLLILSEFSVKSQWVKKEVETAFEKERKRKKLVLFPIKLDETVTRTKQAWAADIRRMRHIGDFTGWKDHDTYQKAFNRLRRDLKTEAQKMRSRYATTNDS